MVKRAYKYRIHPTPGQAQVLTRTFGSAPIGSTKSG
ncbi:helix-turn-helix domain-containing protein [Herbidospora yilanensis]